MSPNGEEREKKTRRDRIDPRLNALGWRLPARGAISLHPHRTEEEETANGPADYALWLDNKVVGVVEAKRLTIGPQNVLMQAERYARGLKNGAFDFEGLRAPFLYSTNGEQVWFHDVRHPLNRSRRLADFHTPNALKELLGRDFDAATARLRRTRRSLQRRRRAHPEGPAWRVLSYGPPERCHGLRQGVQLH